MIIPKNKNIAFKFNDENEFDELKKILLNIIKNYNITILEYYNYYNGYIFYDDNGNTNNIRIFFSGPKSIPVENNYLIIQCSDVINKFRKKKLLKILKNK